MMTRLTVILFLTFLCNFLYSSNIVVAEDIVTDAAPVTECESEDDCEHLRICGPCDNGYGPDCDQPTCIDGQCGMIRRCSQEIPTTTDETTTTTSTDYQCRDSSGCSYPEYCQEKCDEGYVPLCATARCVEKRCQVINPCSEKLECTEEDSSQCIVPSVCESCSDDFGPECAQAVCENGLCKIISPCSISGFHSSSSSMSTSTTTACTDECQSSADCSYVKQCVEECPDGLGPLCAFGTCVDGKCIITPVCSQKLQCTETDLTQCIVPRVCAGCLKRYSPECAEATCVDGECKIIKPCSIYSGPPTIGTAPPIDICTSDDQCPRLKICAVECLKGMTPLCASAECVDGQCISIKPCSQRLCKTAATCPYNRRNCKRCRKGYGPRCEQPACLCGICSIIPPCSKNLLVIDNNLLVTEDNPTA